MSVSKSIFYFDRLLYLMIDARQCSVKQKLTLLNRVTSFLHVLMNIFYLWMFISKSWPSVIIREIICNKNINVTFTVMEINEQNTFYVKEPFIQTLSC